jgi:hypothetical protein
MFNYIYWPFDWGSEVANQLIRLQSHVQITISIAELEKMETEIFKLQNRGVHVELIVFLSHSERGLRNMNSLKRMAISGSNISLVSTPESKQFLECFAILDNKYLISNVDYGLVSNIGELIYSKVKEFHVLLSKSEKLEYAVNNLSINFQVNKTEVQLGDIVDLYWEVENADFVLLDPVIGAVNTTGNISIPVFEDTLFRIKASNLTGVLIKSIFIKIIHDAFISLKISVYDPASKDFVPLESANQPHHSYALVKGDRVKLEWSTSANGIIREERLGYINLYGEHIFQIFDNEKFIFTLETTLGVYNRTIDLFVVVDQYFPIGLKPIESTEKIISPMLFKKGKFTFSKLLKWFTKK